MVIPNEGSVDRIVRTSLGLGLGFIALSTTTGLAQMIVFGISLILLITGLSGFCPLYTLIGINTCRKDSSI